MLEFVTHTFTWSATDSEAVRRDVLAYSALLVSKGFLARVGSSVCHDDAGRTVTVRGIGCAPGCLPVAHSDPDIAGILDRITRRRRVRSWIEYTMASSTQDERYAQGPPWDSLRLSCDCLPGVSPVRAADGGFVARFALPIDDALHDALWAWDTEYSHIYGCWLAGGDYEAWASQELRDDNSSLNRRGRELAGYLARALGCPVEYLPYQLTGR